MKMMRLLVSLFLAAHAARPVPAAELVPPKIENLTSAQRAGSMLVDITYDLIDPDSTAVYLLVEASADGGTTYEIPITALSGDVGLINPGRGKKLVWNAWEDWAGNYTDKARIKLVADDSASATALNTPPVATPTTNLVWIPNGGFRMQGNINVYISRGFWMGQFEVTQGEYEAVMATNRSSFRGSATLPVETVSWNDAVQYCQKLNEREQAAGRLPGGWAYRLPTEAEWEYACRAGTSTSFSYGNDTRRFGFYAWYNVNSRGRTHVVGSRGSSRWGLFDMHGNVWEWCSDWSAGLPGDNATDPQGPPSGSYRVVRGGGWSNGASAATSSNRNYGSPDSRNYDFGFRVVLAPAQ